MDEGENYFLYSGWCSRFDYYVCCSIPYAILGGNYQDIGFLYFSDKKLFMCFIISDALSLFFTSTLVLMFLGILTLRYAEDDFLKSLLIKMIISVFTLKTLVVAAWSSIVCTRKWIIIHMVPGKPIIEGTGAHHLARWNTWSRQFIFLSNISDPYVDSIMSTRREDRINPNWVIGTRLQ